MKGFTKFACGLIAALFWLCGCHAHHACAADKSTTILASTFPIYMFTQNVARDIPGVKVELLVPASAGCPHDFALRPGDVQKLAQADILVINGAGLEEFLDKAIKNVAPNLPVIDASEGIKFMLEHGEANPHTFAAPAEAMVMAANIASKLGTLDPDHASLYAANGQKYQDELAILSQDLAKVGQKAKNRGIALEHDALSYLARNAGLDIVLEFEHGNSAARLNTLKNDLLKAKPKALAGDSQYNDRLLQTLAAETGIPFISLDPCASGPENAPLDYYQKVMRQNLSTLEAQFDN